MAIHRPLARLGRLPISDRLTRELNIILAPLARTFHPTLHVSIQPTASSPGEGTEGCYALLHFTLPDAVFVDRDELADRWGPAVVPQAFDPGAPAAAVASGSGNTGGFGVKAWTIGPKIIDIERPVHVFDGGDEERRGRVDHRVRLGVTLELKDKGMELEVPLHGRYLVPKDSGEEVVLLFGNETDGPSGILRGGWMCGMSSDPNQMYAVPPRSTPSQSTIPCMSSTQVDTGNDTCYHLQLAAAPLPLILPNPPITLTLPTGHPSHQLPVEIITALMIWLGWAYLIRKIWLLVRRRTGVERGKREKVD